MPNRFFHILLRAALCGLAALIFLPAHAETPLSVQDRLQLLYSSRISFDSRGVPKVGVGLMDGKETLRFRSAADVTATVYTPEERKIRVFSDREILLRLKSSAPGKCAYHVVLANLSARERDKIPKLVDLWKERNVDVKIQRVGSILSLGGRIIDNTHFHLVAGVFAQEKEAKRLAARLNRRYDAGAFPFARLERPPSGEIEILDAEGMLLAVSRNLLILEREDGGPLVVPDCEYGQGFSDHGYETRSFKGALYAAIDRNGKLALGNWISMEELLQGTVPAETFALAPAEALKAQAIAARGHLIAKLGTRHLADPFHLCATQHCQVYKGESAHTSTTDAAVTATRGEFLFDGDRLVDATYSASSGGHTENNENTWPQPKNPHLRGRLDGPADPRFVNGIDESNLDTFLDDPPPAYCAGTGFNNDRFRWRRVLDAGKLSAKLDRRYGIGALLEMKAKRRGVSGRILELEFLGTKKSVTISPELRIRRILGNLPSSLFRVRPVTDENGTLLRFELKGAGFGHGVGMCQTGAIGRAMAGQNYREILEFYYNGAKAHKLY